MKPILKIALQIFALIILGGSVTCASAAETTVAVFNGAAELWNSGYSGPVFGKFVLIQSTSQIPENGTGVRYFQKSSQDLTNERSGHTLEIIPPRISGNGRDIIEANAVLKFASHPGLELKSFLESDLEDSGRSFKGIKMFFALDTEDFSFELGMRCRTVSGHPAMKICKVQQGVMSGLQSVTVKRVSTSYNLYQVF